jgi:AcrR family transcriptional regulator
MRSGETGRVQQRRTYHHGDLRAALVGAAVAAARAGGEDAVRLTRLAGQVGVSPAAAYRHFPDGLDELLRTVGDVARAELAERIERQVERAGPDAADRFRASGRAYVEYVTEQPGLFQVASRHEGDPRPGADPHALLERGLDDLVTAGVLPAQRRPWASVAAWSAVHGLAVLMTEGSLARLPSAQREQALERTLDMVARGL